MLRDSRKNEAYFEAYIEYQKKRVDMFARQLEMLGEDAHANQQKIALCSRHLTNFTADLFSAEYSYGCGIETLRATFDQHINYFRQAGEMTMSDALFTFPIAILLEVDCAEIVSPTKIPSDAVSIELFHRGAKSIKPVDSLPETTSDSPSTRFLVNALRGNVTPAELRDYIENRWYDDSSGAAWYNSHNSDSDTYCGYWCYIGAAIAKLLDFDRAEFRGTTYFPYDLFK